MDSGARSLEYKKDMGVESRSRPTIKTVVVVTRWVTETHLVFSVRKEFWDMTKLVFTNVLNV